VGQDKYPDLHGRPDERPDPKKPTGSARSSWGLELRKQLSHQGLRRCMHPRCWLLRKSWWLERNQCRSLSYFRDAGSPFPSGLSALGRKNLHEPIWHRSRTLRSFQHELWINSPEITSTPLPARRWPVCTNEWAGISSA